MNDLLEARLLVLLADHIEKHRGLSRLTAAQTVAQAEVALSHAHAQDAPAEAVRLLTQAFNLWIKGESPAACMLDTFWSTRLGVHKFLPVKFRLHVGAPACFETDGDPCFFLRVSDSKHLHRGGTLEGMALGDFKGEQGRFPDDITVWWEGELSQVQIDVLAQYVQPGCTLTLIRPDTKAWWLGWAGLKFEDKLPTVLYAQYQFTKIFAAKENGCEVTIIGVEGLKK